MNVLTIGHQRFHRHAFPGDCGVNETAVPLNRVCIAESTVSMTLLYKNSGVIDTCFPGTAVSWTSHSLEYNAVDNAVQLELLNMNNFANLRPWGSCLIKK
jgi:hypothetical protein